MSNILIIKHGSLGDIVQISGVIKDIREKNYSKKIFILTTAPYLGLLKHCPYIDTVLLDKRLPRWNLLYLLKLKKFLDSLEFTQVYDLQNSSRTSFYRKYLFSKLNWSSTETILKENENKNNFNNDSVLERFKIQLDRSGVTTNFSTKPDFSWAAINIDSILNQYFSKKFILVFPFCSPELPHKKWPHFNNLIKIIKSKHNNFEIAIAPGPDELNDAKNIKATLITKKEKALNLMELTGLIKKSSYVISNDTGPAHITAHLNKKGLAIFGKHTTAKKVSIETNNFKTISVNDLSKLTAENIYSNIKDDLLSIN